MTSEDRLRYYARFFDTVEVNSSFYAIPAARNVLRWTERTPPGFVFHVKAYASMTGHHARVETLPDDVRAMVPAHAARTPRGDLPATALSSEALDAVFRHFRGALGPLDDARKLGYVLFQFAPWVRFGRDRLAYLETLAARLPGWRLAVEFRDRSWFPDHADETLALLRRAGLAHVIADSPVADHVMPRVVTRTARTSVFRLHGRHAEGWLRQLRGEEPAVREKYDYLYSDDELRGFVPEVDAIAEEADEVAAPPDSSSGDLFASL